MPPVSNDGAAGDGPPAKIAKQEPKAFTNLNDFAFKEVLGGDPAHKSLFVHLQHKETNDAAVLILDKQAFVEDGTVITEWLASTKLEELAVNDIYGSYIVTLPEKFNGIKSTLVYPATDKHLAKYRREEHFAVYETAEDYETITKPHFAEGHSVAWVYNVLEGKSEADRVIFHDKDEETGFLLAPDIKWNGTDVDALYLQAIVHRRDVGCVRSLTPAHLPLLRNIKTKVEEIVKEKYNLKPSQLKMYFHYLPSYFHLHVHIINLKYDAPASGMTSIPLQEAITNIEAFPDYYQKATLMFVKRKSEDIIQKFVAAGKIEI
uniref:m7GpppX diphosphatase n=1 Tax=Panagrellus redivivus TaxID=6233 RepID=A0A7E4W2W2_PANRE